MIGDTKPILKFQLPAFTENDDSRHKSETHHLTKYDQY